MRFLADENIPGDAVTELKTAGHDIVWVRTVAPGSKDEDVLALAVREERIILTLHFALDRLSRYAATLWRQSRQILLALNALSPQTTRTNPLLYR
jgi:predicted nuclease of predicted toxin-antitoxin system